MKKFTTVFGLLSLMLLLTSFTSPVEVGGRERGASSLGEYTLEVGGRERGASSLGEYTLEVGGRERGASSLGE